jgi:hypothetical protein
VLWRPCPHGSLVHVDAPAKSFRQDKLAVLEGWDGELEASSRHGALSISISITRKFGTLSLNVALMVLHSWPQTLCGAIGGPHQCGTASPSVKRAPLSQTTRASAGYSFTAPVIDET